MSVTAVVFDLGGVITESPMLAFAAYEAEAGLPDGLIRRLNSTDPDRNAWARFERNELDVEGFVDTFEAEALAAGHRVDARRVLAAATPGLLVVLGVGAVVFVLAPLMVAVAFALRSRVRAAQRQVRTTLGIALGAVGFFAAVGLARAPLDFSEWWSFVGLWSLLICWFTLITLTALVYSALKRGPGAPPRYPPPWR